MSRDNSCTTAVSKKERKKQEKKERNNLGQQCGRQELAMVLSWLLLGTVRRAVPRTLEAALYSLKSINRNHHNFYDAISKMSLIRNLKTY